MLDIIHQGIAASVVILRHVCNEVLRREGLTVKVSYSWTKNFLKNLRLSDKRSSPGTSPKEFSESEMFITKCKLCLKLLWTMPCEKMPLIGIGFGTLMRLHTLCQALENELVQHRLEDCASGQSDCDLLLPTSIQELWFFILTTGKQASVSCRRHHH
eukprot:615346-Amphidinium_carterae.1